MKPFMIFLVTPSPYFKYSLIQGNPPVIALVEWQTAVVEAADLGLVVGDLSVVLQMETCVVQGESFDKRSVGRVARGSIGHAQAGDGQPLADDLLVPGRDS